MSYDGYQQQRPYNGPVAPRPPPQRQYPQGGPNGPPQQYNVPHPQQYDQYQQGGYDDGYGYNDYDGGYGPDYGQYDDSGYQRGPPPPQNYPPPQDYHGPGPGSGRPMPGPGGGRGGPMPRPYQGDGPWGPNPGLRGGGPGPGPGRGFPNGPPPGRGGPGRPLQRAATGDPHFNRRPAPMSTMEQGFGGSPFPTFPGQARRTDLDQEHEILDQMAGLDISAKRPGPPSSQNSQGSQRSAPPIMDGPQSPTQRAYPQGGGGGYPEPRRGPGPGSNAGHGPTGDFREPGFGPPARTRTMPNVDTMGMRGPPPPRGEMVPYDGPAGPGGRGMPTRPSTAQAMRGRNMPPPHGAPMGPPGPPQDGQYQGRGGGRFDGPGAYEQPQQRPASFDDFYDYYDQPASRVDGNGYPARAETDDMTDFNRNAYPPRRDGRNSLDDNMNPVTGPQEQRAPGRLPELSRAKSQPDLRQPQTAVFDMVSEMPPIPGQYKAYQVGQPTNGSASASPVVGLPNGPAPGRHGSGASVQSASNPDALPSHPTPVRPGLIPNSVASQMVNKPAPVRNYNSATPPGQNGPDAMQARPPPLASAMNPGSGDQVPRPGAEPPVTADELERLRSTIKADPNDQATALRLAKRLVEAMDVIVPNIPDPRARAKMRERYAADAHKIFKKLVHAQNPDAMFAMADCLGRGVFGGEPDNKEAFTLYQSAAKLGVAAAAYRTAVCCEIGQDEGGGTRKDPAKAVQWYKRAATLGDTPAMYKVGMILLKGLLGQPRNPREAVGWLKRAAERADAENPHALHELGLLYESAQPNDAILRDEPYAFRLFQQAAELGYKFSQFRLGAAYEYGLMGCPIDPRLSIMWYSRAATQEEHQSELALSGWYLTGSEGVLAQSDTEAYLWARKAALAGLAKAEYAMGYFTEVGIGLPANLDDAKRWYWRAAAQDFPKARERLEDLKRTGKNAPTRQRERISRSTPKQEGECVVM